MITVTAPPFAIHEVGWGQFPINIKLYFADPSCKPVETVKDLVLFDDMNPTTKRPIVTEDYNEIVFVDPNLNMLRLLSKQSEVQQSRQAAQAASALASAGATAATNGEVGAAAATENGAATAGDQSKYNMSRQSSITFSSCLTLLLLI